MNSDKRALPIDDLDGIFLESPVKTRTNRFPDPNRIVNWAQGLNWLFIVCVALPTLSAAIYYGFIASDVYISDSSFVVQCVQDQEEMKTDLGSILKSSASSTAGQDAAEVQEFMKSRDALEQLENATGIREAYSNSDIDPISRFGGVNSRSKSFEHLYRYYSKWIVSVHPSEASSSISELEVRAFTPDEAALINGKLLEMGEKLVNQLNDRLQQDLVRYAQQEVDIAETKAEAAYAALAAYRNANTVVDPEHQSALQLDLILKLQESLIDTRNDLAELNSSAANNPQISALQNKIRSLETEISSEMATTTGEAASLTNKAADYERLVFERDYSQKQLAAALTFLDESRNEAQRKQLYLKRIVEPNTPDYAIEPRRARNVIAVLVLGLMVWGIVALFSAGVREHQQ
jgi:capsular polysaccharide transport system permease protein